jgi:hypothetical protein
MRFATLDGMCSASAWVIFPGMKVEIRSVHTTGIGCAMSNSNVFGQ